jgi:hypothetical protein
MVTFRVAVLPPPGTHRLAGWRGTAALTLRELTMIAVLSLIPRLPQGAARKLLILAAVGFVVLMVASSCGSFPGPSNDDFPF